MKLKSILLTALATISLATATMAQVPNYVPTNGLVGWWPFNGNANDESANGNNGTVNGATLTSDRFGNANKAYNFNGTTSYVKVNNSSSLESANLSISFWIKSTGNQFQQVFYKVTPNTALNETYSVPLNLTQTGTLNFDLKNNNCNPAVGWQYCSGNIGNISSWTNFVLTHDGSITRIYKNGQLLSTIPGAFPISNCPGGDLLMGCDWQMNNKLNGQLDDIGIWNRAINQQEINDLYNGNICYQTITVTDTLIINMGITGFNPVTYNNTIKIFPNPTNDHITIDFGNFSSLSGYQLKIINSLSQQVFQTNITQQSNYLNLTNWGGNGLYFVQIIDTQGNIVDIRKIVLQ
jgi:hypothetical protein